MNNAISPSGEAGAKVPLRRLDWRFLLPSTSPGVIRHLLLFGGPDGLGKRIVETKLAEQVSYEIEAETRADAAVILHNSAVRMEHVAPYLQSGGVLYQEITRSSHTPLSTSLDSLRKRCRQAGLTLTGLYWAAPNFERCRRYIPLDTPGALAWYFSSLFVAGTSIDKGLREIFRLPFVNHRKLLARFAPALCLTAVAGESHEHPPAILEHPSVAAAMPKEELRPIVLTSGQDDASRVILLPFSRHGGSSPCAVVKIATDAKFNRETENEQLILSEVRARVDSRLQQGIPEPRQRFYFRGLAGGVESCAPGHSLWLSSGEWGVSTEARIADMQLGVDWLIEFHRQTQKTRLPWNLSAIQCWIEEPLTQYTVVRGVNDAEQALFSRMREHAHSLINAEIPLVWQHNDFAPWNLFRAGDQLTVIDWEFNRDWERTQAGPPLCDLLYFLTYWNNVAQRLTTGQAELAGIYNIFLAPGNKSPYQQAARQAVTRYLTALQVDERFVPLFLVYTWLERVIYSHARLQKLEKQTSTSRAADKFASYVGLFADHMDELFSVDSYASWMKNLGEGTKMRVQSPAAEALP